MISAIASEDLTNLQEVPIAMADNRQFFQFTKDSAPNHFAGQTRPVLPDAQMEDVTHINETTLFQSASSVASAVTPMDVGTRCMVNKVDDSGTGEDPEDTEHVIERTKIPERQEGEETSYGILGSATALEHFGEKALGPRSDSRSLHSSVKRTPSAQQSDEERLLAAQRNLFYQKTPTRSRQSSSQKAPQLQQQSRYVGILSSNSSMPTPTFENTDPDHFPLNASNQHPSVRAGQVQKALDESNFISSNVFPGSTSGQTQDD